MEECEFAILPVSDDQDRPVASATSYAPDESPKAKEDPRETLGSLSGKQGTVHITLAGKSGAGKSTLAKNILNLDGEMIVSAGQITKECKTQECTKHGITIKITDTVGLEQKKATQQRSLMQMSDYVEGKADVLVFCISVELSQKFAYSNPDIIKTLNSAYGQEIWKQCIVVFTFANNVWNNIIIKEKSEKTAIAKYKKLLNEHAAAFTDELHKLKLTDIEVKTVFGYQHRKESNQNNSNSCWRRFQ